MNYERMSTIKDLCVFRAFRLWSPFSHFSHTLFTRKTKPIAKKEEKQNYGLIFKQEILWAHKYVSANCLPASMGMCSVGRGGGGCLRPITLHNTKQNLNSAWFFFSSQVLCQSKAWRGQTRLQRVFG